ncbi:MAG: type II toxin-antitoxin system VapC family toxin [bacterium]
MNLYVDTSALVKLYVVEEGSETVKSLVRDAELAATSALAYAEARAAFARRHREGELAKLEYRRVVKALDADWPHLLRVQVVERLIHEAAHIVDEHGLRAYDAIHLASALELRRGLQAPVTFACWDSRLLRAARQERLTPQPAL